MGETKLKQIKNQQFSERKTNEFTMKKQPNNSKCASALQITLSVTLICVSLILFASISGAGPAASRSQGVVMNEGKLTSFTDVRNGNEKLPDLTNLRPMPLPLASGPTDRLPSVLDFGKPGFSSGADGNGETNPVTLALPREFSDMVAEGPVPLEFGTSQQPFSTARAVTNTASPFRASGLLTGYDPNNNQFGCSASLVKRGVVVTAAHCVALYGAQQFYHGWNFYPGYKNGVAPFGVQTAATAFVMTSYYNGTDNCAVYGVVCPDDVAVIVLNPDNLGHYVGGRTGWYGYGWNGWGFENGNTHVTQIGYPANLDNESLMERNDSQGFVSGSFSSNTVIGSLMGPGSSGGPWVDNFGIRPTLTGTSSGAYALPNITVGVTSWGYTDPAVKQQGASPFTSGNITVLVNAACSSIPAACR
jgi:V8-like Glu-specific endopeptidase